ncbi:TraK domain-containing protein [Vibrio parahaemolyticus]
MKVNSIVLALSIALGVSSAVNASDEIPVVPVSVMKNNVPAPIIPDSVVNQRTTTTQGKSSNLTGGYTENSQLVMEPGVNQIIPISIGHPNRIVTPFGKPEVTSTSLQPGQSKGECGEICIKENVIYVATAKEYPVTMFITEKGSEARALSLTMVPQRIPPREVFLKLDNNSLIPGMFANNKAKSWEQSQPYIETLRTVFRKLALGEVPNGYSMNHTPSNVQLPKCEQPGISVDFDNGQMMMGHHLTVFVGIARNVTGETIEFKEQSCGNWNVAGVTSWPHKVLEPGQRTEVYVAVKQREKTESATRRPSLLSGGK